MTHNSFKKGPGYTLTILLKKGSGWVVVLGGNKS
jgi:hypothetical protein